MTLKKGTEIQRPFFHDLYLLRQLKKYKGEKCLVAHNCFHFLTVMDIVYLKIFLKSSIGSWIVIMDRS